MILAAIPFPDIDPALFTIPAFSLLGFEIGPLSLRWYALAYIAGLVLGWRLIRDLMKRPKLFPGGASPMAPEKTDDLLFWMTLGVVLGGRLGFTLFYRPELLWQDPTQILRIWEGGMAFHGGMIGVILAVIWFSRVEKVPLLSLGDAVAVATPIGLLFGRLANFINGELWGRMTDVSWGMVFPQVMLYAEQYPWVLKDGENVPRHPSQLYEAALEGALLLGVLTWLAYRTEALKRPGFLTGVFLAGYGLTRGFCEFFRQYNVEIGFDFFIFGVGITRGQVLCIPMIVAGAVFIYYAHKRARLATA
ncbi:MAG: prolipoprotein diacylglyceryl transferase [Pseudomonadota bacterium]